MCVLDTLGMCTSELGRVRTGAVKSRESSRTGPASLCFQGEGPSNESQRAVNSPLETVKQLKSPFEAAGALTGVPHSKSEPVGFS